MQVCFCTMCTMFLQVRFSVWVNVAVREYTTSRKYGTPTLKFVVSRVIVIMANHSPALAIPCVIIYPSNFTEYNVKCLGPLFYKFAEATKLNANGR